MTMSVQDYEVIDNLDRIISSISRDEGIDRQKTFGILQKRLKHQQRRIEAFLAIGWVDRLEPIKPAKENGSVIIHGSVSPGSVIITGNGNVY
jgi:hypothetical protein